jgi:hypothetical protein
MINGSEPVITTTDDEELHRSHHGIGTPI